MSAICQIICDSTCDFSAQQAQEYNVKILPFHYTEKDKAGGGLSGDDDLFQSRSAHEFYDAIRHGACPMTSQPSQYEYEQAFEEAYASGVPTVVFSISSKLSGGYEGALMALERVKEAHPEEEVRIYVVDSKLASVALHLLVFEACRKRDAGMNAEELVLWAKEARYNVHTVVLVDNLDALHRGGRLPTGVAVVGDALDVKPILHINVDGSLGIRSVARGRKKAMRKMIEHVKQGNREQDVTPAVVVGDADAPEDGYQIGSEITRLLPDITLLRPTVGPTIGSHVGPSMLACSFWGEDRRNEKKISRVKGVRTSK